MSQLSATWENSDTEKTSVLALELKLKVSINVFVFLQHLSLDFLYEDLIYFKWNILNNGSIMTMKHELL